MKKRFIHALLGVGIIIGLLGLVLVGYGGIRVYRENTKADIEDQAFKQDQEELAELNIPQPTSTFATTTTSSTTIPNPVAPMPSVTSTIPSTTTEPSTTTPLITEPLPTTTTVAPFTPDRSVLPVNQVFGWVQASTFRGGERLTLSRADETDSGDAALKGGGVAWFPSVFRYDDGTASNDLSLPGEGGVVAIGGHRGGYARTGPFATLDQLQVGDHVTVATTYQLPQADGTMSQRSRVSQYQVTDPCLDGAQDHCTLHVNDLLKTFADYQGDVETLFLFSCDEGMRIFVKAELVSEMVI